MLNIRVTSEIEEDELVEMIASQVDADKIVEFFHKIDKSYEDWEVTENVAMHFVKVVVDVLEDYPEDPIWCSTFKNFLLEQANRIK